MAMTTPRILNFALAAAALALVCAPPHARAQKPDARASANEKLERGKQLYDQGEAAAAIPLLRAAAESLKNDPDAWYLYGLALSRAGRAKDAVKAFDKTLKLRPDDALARTGLAFSLLLLNKPGDAEREARRAMSKEPPPAEAHYIVGV